MRWVYESYVRLWRKWALWMSRRRPIDSAGAGNENSHFTFRKILVVCTGLIGDSILCTPAIKELRRLFPDSQIVGLVKRHNWELFDPSGWFDDFILCEASPFAVRPQRRRLVALTVDQLRGWQFDLALILLGGDWAPLIYRCGIPVRVDSADNYFAPLATHLYSIDPRRRHPDECLNALRCLGLDVKSCTPEIRVCPVAKSATIAHLVERGFSRSRPLVVFHPFGATANRSLSPNKTMTILRRLAGLDIQVAVIGSHGAIAVWRRVIGNLSIDKSLMFDFVGRLSLRESCALIELADAVLTTDSGPLHIAGALRRPTVGLFRAIRPEYATLYDTVIPLFWEGGPECLKGCSWDSWYGCREAPCRQLEGIEDDKIVESVVTLVAGGNRER